MQKIKQKNRKLFLFTKVFYSFLFLFLFSVGFFAKAAPESIIYFNPQSKNAEIGEVFTLESRINPASNEIGAVDMTIIFDKTKLKLLEIVNGSSFPTVLVPADITNEYYGIVVGIGLTTPLKPVITDSVVATLKFEVIGAGESSVTYSNDTIAAALNEDDSNVIITKSPAQIKTGSDPEKKYKIEDFIVLVADWLKKNVQSLADVNEDLTVNSRDLGIMMSNWE